MNYENIDNKLQQKLIEITAQDIYSLSPKTLYRNILHSTGDYKTLSQIFEVPLEIIQEIKAEEIIEIKSYLSLDIFTKKWLDQIVSENKMGISPKTAFTIIYENETDEHQFAQLLEIPIGLIRAIKK